MAAVIKGGYEVTVAGLRAFCPFSQMDVRRVETAEDLVGRVLEFRIATYGENGRNIVLSGSVSTKDIIEKAVNVATGYVDKRDEVVTLMQLRGDAPSNQVLLRVRFAEVSRSAMTELGASLFTSPTGVRNTIGRATTGQFSAPGFSDLQYSKADSSFGGDVTTASGNFTFSDFLNLFFFSEKYDIGAVIKLLQTGFVRNYALTFLLGVVAILYYLGTR